MFHTKRTLFTSALLCMALLFAACGNKPAAGDTAAAGTQSAGTGASSASAGSSASGSSAATAGPGKLSTSDTGANGTSGTSSASSSAASTGANGSAASAGVSADAQSAFPLTVKDEAGNTVTIPAAPRHIVSVTEGTDEMLSALVPKNRLAMVTSFSADPAYSNITSFVQGLPQLKTPEPETIIAAKPDLVMLASYTKPGVVDQIRQAKIPVYEFTDFTSVKGIEDNIAVVGQLVGNTAGARKLNAGIDAKLQAIAAAVKGRKQPTVLDYSSYGYAAGTDTTVGDEIVHAGGINAAGALEGWKSVTDEEVVKLNPDVILVSDDDQGFADKVRNNPALQTVNAVKNKRVYALRSADLSTVSQYVVNGVEDIAHVLYPDVKLP